MKILLVNNQTKHLTKLQKLLKEHVVQTIGKDEFTCEIAKDFEVVIFSGGSNVATVKNHQEVYKNETEFILKSDKKVIGICLGCEIIARAFNCNLIHLKSKVKGIIDMSYDDKVIPVFSAHNYAIKTPSPEIKVLATSTNGIEIFKHKLKPIYGIQFHPEISLGNNLGHEIFLKILEF